MARQDRTSLATRCGLELASRPLEMLEAIGESSGIEQVCELAETAVEHAAAFARAVFPLSHHTGAMMADTLETLKFYYDFKSPFSYLALAPTLALEASHRVQIRFIPHE